ncbi:hypothetical protein [Tautonia plasticadhaerens]|uniref:Uncharacterized protein n=1 Tax=Tautonia plasticadhaerens TaxID=2527974 RepID=A0A518H6E5_9BACT|nr:hypothetical protein [Tautonia plasticadhaerens]QDV36417.1 hypothetical protein ElP_43410 [Tautonia plasticadhaerens]
MIVEVDSRLVGTFLGYAPGAVHRLDDGSEWEQVGNVKEYVYRERPACRILQDQDRLFLDVEGTSGIAEVRQFHGKRWSGAGAY